MIEDYELRGLALAWMRFSDRNDYTCEKLGRLSSDALFFRQARIIEDGSSGSSNGSGASASGLMASRMA